MVMQNSGRGEKVHFGLCESMNILNEVLSFVTAKSDGKRCMIILYSAVKGKMRFFFLF